MYYQNMSYSKQNNTFISLHLGTFIIRKIPLVLAYFFSSILKSNLHKFLQNIYCIMYIFLELYPKGRYCLREKAEKDPRRCIWASRGLSFVFCKKVLHNTDQNWATSSFFTHFARPLCLLEASEDPDSNIACKIYEK